jgi:hypothetical protein
VKTSKNSFAKEGEAFSSKPIFLAVGHEVYAETGSSSALRPHETTASHMNAETVSGHVSATAAMQTREPGRSTDPNSLALFTVKKNSHPLGVIFLDLPSSHSFCSMWNHIRISGISCPARHIRGMFTFHSVIFKSYSTAVYFSNVSEGSFGHLLLWVSLPFSC